MLIRIPSGKGVDFRIDDPKLAKAPFESLNKPLSFVWVRGHGMFETRGCEGVVDDNNNYILVAVLESL